MDFGLFIPLFSGLLAGGLINYLADVLPYTLRFSQPTCPNPDCKAAFRWVDYLLLRGCQKCGRGRGLRAYATPILAVALSLFIWVSPSHTLGFTLGLLILTYLLLVTVIDLEHRLILRPLSIIGLFLAALAGIYAHGWQSTLVGGAAGFTIMFIFYLLGLLFVRWRTQRMLRARQMGNSEVAPTNYADEEALGSGDVTLAAILGLLLGWPGISLGLLLGILLGGVGSLAVILWLLARRNYNTFTAIPYAPFLILSAAFLLFGK